MATRKHTYIDFTKVPWSPSYISGTASSQATAALFATGANTTESKVVAGDKEFCVYNTGATTVTSPIFSSSGMTYPVANGAFGCQLGEGWATGAPNKSFTIGTDPAFFLRVKVKNTLIASQKALLVGFRKSVAYETCKTTAEATAAYDDKFMVGTNDSGAHFNVLRSTGAADAANLVLTTPAAPMVNATTYDIKVMVSAAGVVTATIDGVAIAAATSAAYTFTNALAVVPAIFMVNDTSGAACDAQFVEYECGYQEA